jgi:hypothetical protein
MSDKKVSGKARGMLKDVAELWLKQNDPDYKASRRKWTVPDTDLLARILSEKNEPHPSLDDLDSMGDGHFQRRKHIYSDDFKALNFNTDMWEDDSTLEDDYSENSRP